MPQNLLDIGINLAELESQKQQALAIVADFYAKLNTFEGNKVNVIGITGLTELNAATKANQTSTEQLNTSISNLGITLKTYNQLAEQNVSLSAKLYETNTAEAKTNAELKVALSEKNKELQNEARLTNETYQARQKAIIQQREQQQLYKQANAESNDILRQQIQLEKQEEVAKIALNKQASIEGKNMLLLNDQYKQLLLTQKDLETRYANSAISNGLKAPQTISIGNDLRTVNTTISNIDKGLEKAGSGGATAFARALTSGLSSLRTIAYILPGIGIAGIFNLAFEAVESAAESLGFFNDKIEKDIALQKELADNIAKVNDVIKDEADLISGLSTADINYYQNQDKFSKAAGLNYESEIDDLNKLAIVKKQQADANVDVLGASHAEVGQLDAKLDEIDGQRKKVAEKIIKVNEEIKRLNTDNDQTVGNILGVKITDKNRLLESGKIGGAEDLNKTLKSQLDAFDAQFTEVKNRRDQIKSALDNQTSADEEQKSLQLKNAKYFSDEERRITLDSVTQQVDLIKNKNAIILSSELSTEQQRKNAINSVLAAEIRLAAVQRDNVLNNVSSTSADKSIAVNDFTTKISELRNDAIKNQERNTLLFFEKRSDLLLKQQQDEITIEQNKNRVIYGDDVKSYDDRVFALQNYIKEKNDAIELQYKHDLELAKKTTSPDLLPEKVNELNSGKAKQQQDVVNEIQSNIYGIVESWYQKQSKALKDAYDKNTDETDKAETKDLIRLNNAYDKKIISFKHYLKQKEKLEQEYLLKGDLETIANDKEYLNNLYELENNIDLKILAAKGKLQNSQTPSEKEDAQKELNKLIESRKDVGNQIDDQSFKTDKDKLKYEQDKNKKIIKDTSDFKEVLLKVYEDLLNDVKSIVDAEYEYRLAVVEKNIALFDRQVDAEKDAIDRSTLNAKDKNAYTIQLDAQKAQADKEAAQKEKKIKHDEAVFNREIDIAQIILNTELGVSAAVARDDIVSAIAIGIIGAAALATAVAVKIPSFAIGGTHLGGLARFGEAGNELVKEPGKQPYMATRETVAYLPKGTDLIPMYETPTLSTNYKDDSWKQTKYLASVIKKGNKRIDSTIHNHIKIDLGYTTYKNNILHG